jgi:hypothetical protein
MEEKDVREQDAELGGEGLRKRLSGVWAGTPWIENTLVPRKRPTKTLELCKVASWTNFSHREDLKAESPPGLLVGLCPAK